MINSETEQGLEELLKIVYIFLSKDEAEPFKEPVDWERLELLDYPDIVKNPMDLGTLKRNLQRGVYKSLDEAARDMRLIWTNCMTYNQDGSEYYHLADTFANIFEEKYSELRRSMGILEDDPERVPTIEQKIQMTYDLFKIDSTQLGKVLTVIDSKCNRAIIRETINGNEEAFVNIDYLTPSCFHEISDYIKTCNLSSSGNNKKKRPNTSTTTNTSNKKSTKGG